MPPISRRSFLRAGGALAAAAAIVPRVGFGGTKTQRRVTGTTLDATIVKGPQLGTGTSGAYFRLMEGPGEPHIVRQELARRADPTAKRRSLLHFVHLTDVHLCDAQSPARVEFLDRYSDPGNGCESLPFDAAFRAQETMSLQVFEAMIRAIRSVGVSPISRSPIAFAMCTGDNVDNEQFNELRWFIDLMDGKHLVTPNSGGPTYEGVQLTAWANEEYWHPDAGAPDKYKRQYGFPDYNGLLTEALKPFTGTGVGMPWYQTFGNHDGLMQGNAPQDPVLEQIAVGALKVMGAPPGLDPCDSFEILRSNPSALFAGGPAFPVTADANRRIVSRPEYIDEHFRTTGTPVGHGFTTANRAAGTAYYAIDTYPGFRLISLDTVNPGGYADGSIGSTQFAWLLERLAEVHGTYLDENGAPVNTENADKLVILFSHHGLRSLNNPLITPDPVDLGSWDFPRVMADEIEAALHRFPNVIAWVDGHTHNNIVQPRPGGTGGFWDVGTAAHIDWNSQSRLVEVIDNGDRTLSIVCTMIDHAAPIVPGGGDPVMKLASIHRELAANDFQRGFYRGAGAGTPQDRNVELVIRAPFAIPSKGSGAVR